MQRAGMVDMAGVQGSSLEGGLLALIDAACCAPGAPVLDPEAAAALAISTITTLGIGGS